MELPLVSYATTSPGLQTPRPGDPSAITGWPRSYRPLLLLSYVTVSPGVHTPVPTNLRLTSDLSDVPIRGTGPAITGSLRRVPGPGEAPTMTTSEGGRAGGDVS